MRHEVRFSNLATTSSLGSFSVDASVTVEGGADDGRITLKVDRLEVDEESVQVVDADTGEDYQVISVCTYYNAKSVTSSKTICRQVLGFEYDTEQLFVRVLYDAPSSDHQITLSGNYSGELASSFGIFMDSHIDFQTGETR